ncbi:caspase family protein [Candidatus Parcubacteria bacterium]|nr:caspase family protein [Candidatus Parcubacteria bacterium]
MRKSIAFALLIFALLLMVAPTAIVAKNGDKKAPKQLEARDIKIHKKLKAPLDQIDIMGKPAFTPPADEDEAYEEVSAEMTATGILGDEVIGRKYAIVIGICNYPGRRWDICVADEDGMNMSEALQDVYEFDEIYSFQDLNATRDNIYAAINDIKNKAISANDEVVFFYSGHGVSGVADDNDSETIDEALLVHNGKRLQYIWDGELKEWFSGYATARIAFIFDTCRAGGMNDLAADGRLLIMSALEAESAHVYDIDGVKQPEGLFSHYFVNEGILQGEASFDYGTESESRLLITLEQAYDHAIGTANVINFQTPVTNDNFENDWLP